MKEKLRFGFSIFWVLVGVVLCGLGVAEVIDSYWSGMGGGLLGAGIVQLIRSLRYKSDPEYQAKADRANKDERNKFLAAQAWSWAGYLFVMIAAVGSILFKLADREDLMMLSSGSVCLILILYWLSWLYLSRKY